MYHSEFEENKLSNLENKVNCFSFQKKCVIDRAMNSPELRRVYFPI